MKIWTEARVHLLACLSEMRYPLDISWESDAREASDALPEFAGRLCYLSFGEGAIDGHASVRGRTNNAEYLENILTVKHGSVTEHTFFAFLIQGVSRTCSHELVRHRHLQFSQLSQRYVDESEVGFIVPPELRALDHTSVAMLAWKRACRDSLTAYVDILRELEVRLPDDLSATERKKRARQTARSVLPGCAETKLVVSGNARAWRHFLALRATRAADTEIRELAVTVGYQLRANAPGLFQDLVVDQADDGVVTMKLLKGDA